MLAVAALILSSATLSILCIGYSYHVTQPERNRRHDRR